MSLPATANGPLNDLADINVRRRAGAGGRDRQRRSRAARSPGHPRHENGQIIADELDLRFGGSTVSARGRLGAPRESGERLTSRSTDPWRISCRSPPLASGAAPLDVRCAILSPAGRRNDGRAGHDRRVSRYPRIAEVGRPAAGHRYRLAAGRTHAGVWTSLKSPADGRAPSLRDRPDSAWRLRPAHPSAFVASLPDASGCARRAPCHVDHAGRPGAVRGSRDDRSDRGTDRSLGHAPGDPFRHGGHLWRGDARAPNLELARVADRASVADAAASRESAPRRRVVALDRPREPDRHHRFGGPARTTRPSST